jgi:hypothetical protein
MAPLQKFSYLQYRLQQDWTRVFERHPFYKITVRLNLVDLLPMVELEWFEPCFSVNFFLKRPT